MPDKQTTFRYRNRDQFSNSGTPWERGDLRILAFKAPNGSITPELCRELAPLLKRTPGSIRHQYLKFGKEELVELVKEAEEVGLSDDFFVGVKEEFVPYFDKEVGTEVPGDHNVTTLDSATSALIQARAYQFLTENELPTTKEDFFSALVQMGAICHIDSERNRAKYAR